jgi:hypothetical protein
MISGGYVGLDLKMETAATHLNGADNPNPDRGSRLLSWRHDGSACCPGNIVKWRRHAPVASVARKNAEAGAGPCHLRRAVRAAAGHHQLRVPLRRRRAGARPRRQGREPQRRDSAAAPQRRVPRRPFGGCIASPTPVRSRWS